MSLKTIKLSVWNFRDIKAYVPGIVSKGIEKNP